MQTQEAITQRRSIKSFDPKHKLTKEEIIKIIELAKLSPTSFNMQNWRFLVIDDKTIQAKIKEAAWNQNQIYDASILIVICADLEAANKEPQRYWKDAEPQIQEIIVPMISKFYENNAELKRDEAIRSCGIAAQTIMLTAKDMGYDTCPMIGFDPVKVAEIIKLPKDHIITMLLPLGKALEQAKPRSGSLNLEDVMVLNSF
jgi:nitroreductase